MKPNAARQRAHRVVSLVPSWIVIGTITTMPQWRWPMWSFNLFSANAISATLASHRCYRSQQDIICFKAHSMDAQVEFIANCSHSHWSSTSGLKEACRLAPKASLWQVSLSLSLGRCAYCYSFIIVGPLNLLLGQYLFALIQYDTIMVVQRAAIGILVSHLIEY